MKEINATSKRVTEVQELTKLLESNGMTPFGAMRNAVECVYGMTERFCRHNYGGIRAHEEQYESEWSEAEKKLNHS